MKPERRQLYPDNWEEISREIRINRAKNRCECCEIKNNIIVKRLADGFSRMPTAEEWEMINSKIKYSHFAFYQAIKFFGFTKIVLTVHHIDENPANNQPENLLALFQKCHLLIHFRSRAKARREAKLKNQLAINFEPATRNP